MSNKNYPRRLIRSRLARKEEARNLRRAFFFGGLTFILALLLIFLGIPLFIRMAVFLADIRSKGPTVEQTDILPPAPPRINSLPEYINQEIISLSGFAEPESKIEIFLNASLSKETTSTDEGTFSVDNIRLTLGRNEIYVIATDEAGNKSQPSEKTIIFYDNAPPELTISEPADSQVFTGEKQKKIKILGKTEPEATLYINDHLEIIDEEGNFSVTYTLSEGENLLKFAATDRAENKTEKEIKVIFAP